MFDNCHHAMLFVSLAGVDCQLIVNELELTQGIRMCRHHPPIPQVNTFLFSVTSHDVLLIKTALFCLMFDFITNINKEFVIRKTAVIQPVLCAYGNFK